MEEFAKDADLILQHLVGILYLIFVAFLFVAVHLKSPLHILANAEIIDDKSIVLSWALTVHAADGLNQRMFLQWLIVVHHRERRTVITGNPHIDNDGDVEVLRSFLNCLSSHLR